MSNLHVRRVLSQPEIDAETERRLGRAARSGDRWAREQLITAGLRYVVQRARLLGFGADELDDAVQAGSLGLIAAVDRFDPDRGARLKTFAWWWIGDAMRTAVPRPAAVMDVGPKAAERALDLPVEVPEVLRLRFRLGEPAGPLRPRHEVAALLGLTVAQVRVEEGRAMRRVRAGLAKVGHRAPARESIPHSSIGRAFDC